MMIRLIPLLISIFCSVIVAAQSVTGSGYYRVQNIGTERFLYVKDNTGSYDMVRDVGDFEALQLWKDQSLTISDPSSIIYLEKQSSGQYDLQAQGTGIHDLVSMYVDLHYVSTGSQKLIGSYTVSATHSGVTKYLGDRETGSYADGVVGTGMSSPYRNWKVIPVDSSDDDAYFGITPTVKCGSTYYYPFYADFAFNMPTGMKAYIVTAIDTNLGMVVLKEITGTVPASTPVIIACASGDPSDNRLSLLYSTAGYPSDNLLKGVYFCNEKRKYSSDAITAFDSGTMRVLGVTSEGKLGFVSSSDNLYTYKNTLYLPANQAYLPVSSGTNSELTIVSEEEYATASINSISIEDANSDAQPVYDLQGRRVTEIKRPGLYIRGGKKIVIK